MYNRQCIIDNVQWEIDNAETNFINQPTKTGFS